MRIQDIKAAPRPLRFALVGGGCFLIQIGILELLVRVAGLLPAAANAIGFAVSSQCNFALSYTFTWRNTQRLQRPRDFIRPWGSFTAVTLVALVVNTGLFILCHHLIGLGTTVSAAIGIVGGMGFNYMLNTLVTFRPAPGPIQ